VANYHFNIEGIILRSKTMFFTFLKITSVMTLCFIHVQQHFFTLPPLLEQIFLFEWKTNNHTISVYAKPVSEETKVDNPLITDETMTAKQRLLTATRDIAVVWLSAYPTEVDVGQNTTIEVVVMNFGSSPETFNLTLFVDSNIIHARSIVLLPSYSQKIITFKWNTTNVESGVYTLAANITVLEGEIDTENNDFTDGKMTIKPAFVFPFWTITASFLIVMAVLVSLMILFCLENREEKKPP